MELLQEKSVCGICQKPKATLVCAMCQHPVCKRCRQVLEKDSFHFMPTIPVEFTHRNYCGLCYDAQVAPALETYHSTLRHARRVFIFDRRKGEQTRLMRRSEKPLRIEDGTDRSETLLRLAFLAAKAEFNALIDVEISAEKVRNSGYQTSRWSASGIPTKVDADKLNREDALGWS